MSERDTAEKDAARCRAKVQKSEDGWVATLAGGSVSTPFPAWHAAYEYAACMTAIFRDYWGKPGRVLPPGADQ